MPVVLIDARSVISKKSGIGNYVEALVRHLSPIASEFELRVLRNASEPGAAPLADGVPEYYFPSETKSVSTVFALGKHPQLKRADLYHSPADLIPLGLRKPWVVTIHDLMWLEAPSLASAFAPVRVANSLWYRANWQRSIPGAARIIAISEATRAAIGRHFPAHVHKTRVVHHGVDQQRYIHQNISQRELLQELLGPNDSFSLIVGQGSPYKNQPRMVRAFLEAFRDKPEHKLVLVRRFSRIDKEMTQLLSEPEVRRRVVCVPFVSDEVLLALYHHAEMVLFASLYEGFGMPALEAMAMGTPVLASTTPALLEVTGEGALHAIPDSHTDLVNCMRRLAYDEALRARLKQAARAQVEKFQWDKTASATLEVYREALSAGRPAGRRGQRAPCL